MKTKSTITLSPKSVINVSVSYASLSEDRDFLFKPELSVSYNLGHDRDIFAYVIDIRISFIQAKNATEVSITLYRNIRLDIVVKYSINDCY